MWKGGVLAAWAACALPTAAAASAPGTSAATFLDLGYGARAIGSAEAFVSVANDVSALHYNPAGLAYGAAVPPGSKELSERPYEMMAAQALLVQGIQMTQVGLVNRPFGVSFTRLSLGGIEQRSSETASPDGTFGASDMALGLSYAHQFGGVGLGVTGKFIRETIGSSAANAYAADFGALHRLERWPVSVGLDVANVGTPLRYIDQASPLPMTIRAGVTYGLTRNFPHALTLQLDLPRDSGAILRLGFEYVGFGPIALRAGYQTFSSEQRAAALGKNLGTTASGISEFYGMFMGAGLRSPFGTFDYALVPYGELGTAHRFSFNYSFGGARVKPAATPARIYAQ